MRTFICGRMLALTLVLSVVVASVLCATTPQITLSMPPGLLGDMDVLTENGFPCLMSASIAQLRTALRNGQITSLQLVKAYQARIAEVNLYTRAVLELNPHAERDALASDRRLSKISLNTHYNADNDGPRFLEGIPILIKDNIAEVESGMNVTAGSFALLGTKPSKDAFVVRKLKDAGAIILGMTNMCEWAHGRGPLPYGWSARGGQTLSPFYDIKQYVRVGGNPCGSSSGSAIATTLGLAAASLGTETGWSITCPSHRNSVVGIKPTRGLTSRSNIVPLDLNRDSIGSLTRSVEDGALMLQVIAGKDHNDPATDSQPSIPDYRANLTLSAFHGAKVGISRAALFCEPNDPCSSEDVIREFSSAIKTIKGLGAEVIDPLDCSPQCVQDWRNFNGKNPSDPTIVLRYDTKAHIEGYLAGLTCEKQMTLQDIVNFNNWHPLERPPSYTSQSWFQMAATLPSLDCEEYKRALFNVSWHVKQYGLGALMDKHQVDVLLALVDEGTPSQYAALEGLPVITVPLGFYSVNVDIGDAGNNTVYPAPGIPFGLMFIGQKWTEQKLLGYAYAFEQATKVRGRVKDYILEKALPKTGLEDVVDLLKL